MVRLDGCLTQEERNNISEIYWGCRFGKCLEPLMTNNKFYPNLKNQYFISDEVGRREMANLDGVAVDFWHFRPDFHHNYNVGLSLFGLKREEVNPIDAASIFRDAQRKFIHSSFLDIAEESEVDWQSIDTKQHEYILVHYPTSTRPRSDIAQLDNNDWNFIINLSKERNLKIVVVTDTEINTEIPEAIVLKTPSIKTVVALAKYAGAYAGCDSFLSILSCKVLEPNNLFVKSHNRNVQQAVYHDTILAGYYSPYSPDVISRFYKPYVGN